MRRFGLLYEKLVVMPGQNLPVYYMMVKRVLREARAEFPHEDCYDFGDKRYEEWFKKWFGSDLVKKGDKNEVD